MLFHILVYIHFSLIVLSLPLDADRKGKEDLGYFKLETKKLRGTKFEDAKVGAEPQLLVRRDGSDSDYIPLDLQNERTFYLAELEFGSTNQTIGVLIDTGSSDLWVLDSNNTYCETGTDSSPFSNKGRALSDIYDFNVIHEINEKNKTFEIQNTNASSIQGFNIKPPSSSSGASNCQYGTFNPSDSNTFINNRTSFSITYADSSFARGTWGHDDVRFNGITVNSLSFAVCDNSNNEMGVLGIGLAGLETTYSGGYSTSSNFLSPYQYENLPLRLRSQGIIQHVAYSIYLNDSSSETANILFGAVDHSKYSGDLIEIPIINVLGEQGYNFPIQIDITLNSITLVDNNRNQQAILGSGASFALLDTGTTLSYIPAGVLSLIVDAVDAQFSSSLNYYVMDCSSAGNYALAFNFQGFEIDVPLSSFLVSLVTTNGGTSSYCLLGLQSSETSSFILGDSFLRNVYMVADLENLSVALAIADYSQGLENIEVISSSIPSAIQPISPDATWGAVATTLEIMSAVSMSERPSTSSILLNPRTTSDEIFDTSTFSNNGVVSQPSTSGTRSAGLNTIVSISSTNSRNGSGHTVVLGGIMGTVLALLTLLI